MSFQPPRRLRRRSVADHVALLDLEALEERRLLTAVVLPYTEYHVGGSYPTSDIASRMGILPFDNGTTIPTGYSPQQLQTAYGLGDIQFGGKNGTIGNGTGQTIAIVNAYDDPDFYNSTSPNFGTGDLAQFDLAFNLTDPPSFMKYNEHGGTKLPGTDPAGPGNSNGNWEVEEALDIEWSHSIAPGAAIDLVEASSSTTAALFTAVKTAASLPGVSVVSMSWGLDEIPSETTYDSSLVTPSGHVGVTFVASSGDSGSPGYYPAYSPNVVAAGGTTLPLDAQGDYPGTGLNGEVAWSDSGGGTSQYESEPSYQLNVQSTGKRTMPDVAWDADPNTGVSVYDSYNDTDGSGPWVTVGGTSISAPSWSGIFAIVNQGRVLAGGEPFNTVQARQEPDPTQTLTALYSLPASDFHDILYGSNGGYSAGPGYDEVTGLGSPNGSLLVPSLVAYQTSNQMVITAQPPGSAIAGDSFGLEVAAEDNLGYIDPAYTGTLSLSLTSNPGNVTFATMTSAASNGVAVFDGIELGTVANGYEFQVTSPDFPSITTDPVNIIANPTPWAGTFYPVPTDSSLRSAISEADSDDFAANTIELGASTYVLTDTTEGQVLIENTSQLANKSVAFVGQGAGSTIIEPGVSPWNDRLFEVSATGSQTISVVFQGLTIEGGNAIGGGTLGGSAALGGAILVNGGTVALSGVTLTANRAAGPGGNPGTAGKFGQPGSNGGNGENGQGGAIYLAQGTLSLSGDVITGNVASGGAGGKGGTGGLGRGTKSTQAATGGAGGDGGTGGSAEGGGVYVAGGRLVVANVHFSGNQAIGGAGGAGGSGGSGGLHKFGGIGGNGHPAGLAYGGAIFLAQGTATITALTLEDNSALGGAGGIGGSGGFGGGDVNITGSITSILGGGGSSFARIRSALSLSGSSHGSASGQGGAGGQGA